MRPQPPRDPRRIRFKPVELKARHDGWTPARQFRFIEVLAATRSVAAACRAVGMSRESAYTLLERSGADPEQRGFGHAWSEALKPDFAKERRRSPRATARLRRLARINPKVDEVNEMHAPPDSPGTVNQLRQDRPDCQL